MPKYTRGFTIVELLIVVIVVAVLAAVVSVGFASLRTRADTTKTVSAVTGYARALNVYGQLNGTYPTAPWACLADADTNCGQLAGGAAVCFGVGGAARNSTTDAAVLTQVSSLPRVSDTVARCSGLDYQGGFMYSPDSKNMNIYYFLKGNQQCPSIAGTTSLYRSQQDDATFCAAQFPTL